MGAQWPRTASGATANPMRQVLARLPIQNIAQLKTFETELRKLTMGFSVVRSTAYTGFRMSVLQYHQTGKPTSFRAILAHNHFIRVSEGVATLYRNVQDRDDPFHETPLDEAVGSSSSSSSSAGVSSAPATKRVKTQ
jgi:hypothetical protein